MGETKVSEQLDTFFHIDTPLGKTMLDKDGNTKQIIKRETSNGREIVKTEYILEDIDE
jgi:hypothetical protein